MGIFRAVIGGCILLFFGVTNALCDTATGSRDIAWKVLEPGLEFARAPVVSASSRDEAPPGGDAEAPAASPVIPNAFVSILRIDPERFGFSLHMASESGARSLASLGKGENLVAAVNAGMYLPDNSTSTGYLRSNSHTNNPRVAAGFGAFFVAEPQDASLPRARLLDRARDDWQTAIHRYDVVMQNYRMTTAEGRVIWKQPDRTYSIAALSQDDRGRVLFLLCATPVPAMDFITTVLALPLDAKSLMYLEGGSEAALLVRAGDMDTVEAGRHPSGLWGGNANLLLPNVLGVFRRP